MDLFLKRAEKIFFIVINLVFSSAFIQIESISNFGLFILWTFFQVTYKDFANSGNDIELLFWGFLFWLLFMIVKLCMFPMLYGLPLKRIHAFLDKFLEDKRYTLKVLLSALIFDQIVCQVHVILASLNFDNFDEFVNQLFHGNLLSEYEFNFSYVFALTCLFGGVFICYLSFFIFEKIKRKLFKKRNLCKG